MQKETDHFNKRVNDMDRRIAKIEQDLHKLGSAVRDDVNKMEKKFINLDQKLAVGRKTLKTSLGLRQWRNKLMLNLDKCRLRCKRCKKS